MITRQNWEKNEELILSKYATKAVDSKGRIKPEEKCRMRTDFQRDRDRIIHSKAFRRLMHKTQVFISPERDHFRTRLTHTIEVAQIARTISRALGLNEDLTEAIAMGHDLGHTPFGHSGEMVLNKIYPGGFKHNEQSLRVVDILDTGNTSSKRKGMNLTYEVRDGILNHTGGVSPITLEGQVVKVSDRIAYINHDIDDAIESKIISVSDLPKYPIEILGKTHRERIDTLVNDMVKNSFERSEAKLSDEKNTAMNELRKYMFENIYLNSNVKKAEEINKIEIVIESLYEYYLRNSNKLPFEMINLLDLYKKEEIVKDYIAGMTDRYALNMYENITRIK